MIVKVLRDNHKVEIYEDVRKAYNLSTRLNTDALCIEKYTDGEHKPSIIIKKCEVICWNCEEEIRGGIIDL